MGQPWIVIINDSGLFLFELDNRRPSNSRYLRYGYTINDSGMFSGRHPQFDRAEDGWDSMKKNLSYLILMLTDRCNLSCSYCYLGHHKKSMTHDDVTDMPFDSIDQALELFAANKENCRIQITDGEPLLVPRQFGYTVKKIRIPGNQPQ